MGARIGMDGKLNENLAMQMIRFIKAFGSSIFDGYDPNNNMYICLLGFDQDTYKCSTFRGVVIVETLIT